MSRPEVTENAGLVNYSDLRSPSLGGLGSGNPPKWPLNSGWGIIVILPRINKSLALPSCFLDGVFYMYFVMIEDDSEDGLRKALTFMGTAEFLQVTIDAAYCSLRYVQESKGFNFQLVIHNELYTIHASSAGRPAWDDSMYIDYGCERHGCTHQIGPDRFGECRGWHDHPCWPCWDLTSMAEGSGNPKWLSPMKGQIYLHRHEITRSPPIIWYSIWCVALYWHKVKMGNYQQDANLPDGYPSSTTVIHENDPHWMTFENTPVN